MVRQIIIIIIFLSSATFYSLVFLPKRILLLVSFASTVLVVVVVILNAIYDRGKRFEQHFTVGISFILLSVFLSMIGAYIGHQQGFFLSFWVQSPMLLYFFYAFLHATRVKPEELEKLMILMAILWMVFWLSQWAIFPVRLFDVGMASDRGTVRIFLPGGIYAMMMYFYFLQSFFRTNSLKDIAFCLILLIITLLGGTRSAILPLLLVTVINLIFSKRVKSKFMISIFMVAGMVIVFFIFQDFIMGLIELSEHQAAREEDDIRTRATRFYLTEFYPNKINYIIGNGAYHMANAYGIKILYYQTAYGYWLSDTGIFGVYVKLGIFYFVGVFILFRKIFISRIESRYLYFKYFAVLLLISELMGGVFAKPSSFIAILAMLYIIDVSTYKLKEKDKESKLVIE